MSRRSILRQPVLDDGIADGSQDDLVVLVHTDEGITGIGEVDSAPEAVRALINAPGSHAIANSLHDLLVGEDPTDVERLWHKMYRGLIYIGRRGHRPARASAASTSPSGTSRARRSASPSAS